MGPLDNSMPSIPAKARNKKRIALVAGIAALCALPILQSTFASNISINGSSTIEFGQGAKAVVACDSAVTITPHEVFWGASALAAGAPGSFIFSGVTIEGSGSFAANCAGKEVRVSTISYAGNVLETYTLNLNGTATSPATDFDDCSANVSCAANSGPAPSSAILAGGDVELQAIDQTDTGTNASDVYGITIETN